MTSNGLVDSNILIYAHDTDSPFFDKASDFLQSRIEDGTVCFALQNITEAFRIWTQKLQKPISTQDAWSIADYYIHSGIQIINPSPDAYAILKKLTITYRITGVHIFDALLVATMIEHNISTIFTVNTKDFSVYREVKTVNPIT